MVFSNKKTLKERILVFFFSFYPIKILKHNLLLIILASLIALSVVLGYVKIKIPNVNISISFSWLPTVLTGWFFGPIIGMFMGAITDTLNYLLHGGVWYWLYFIQEPLVGLVSGLISSIAYLLNQTKNKNLISYIFSQLVINLFFIFTLSVLLVQINSQQNLLEIIYKKNKYVQWYVILILVITLLSLFYIVFQIIINYKYIRNKKYKSDQYNNNFLYLASLSIIITFIFSFILGPVSTIEFYKYINNKPPSSLIKYGTYYYLIPRIIKEIFKTPLYIILLNSLVLAINPQIKNVKYNVINRW